ncbi:MAG TPA: N-acetylneuraminate synthase family protein [Methanocella sp.]|nr:N-acetylneuraminate synthase family protein [Methanocella sp.]
MSRTKIIAEAAANHNGDIRIMKDMIRVAKESGADYIKFQSWLSNNLITDDSSNRQYYKEREVLDETHFVLRDECRSQGIKFLTTCFDIGRIDFLKQLGLTEIKVASPDLGSSAMIEKLRDNFDHLIISTGMSYGDEVRQTASIMKGRNFTLLHCISLYPTPPEKVNMARMDWLRQFTPSVGFSDHTFGTAAAKIAIARGADYVEKHFTLDRSLPGRDQPLSAEPAELKEICDFARTTETMMGDGRVDLFEDECPARKKFVGRWGNNK